MLLIYLKRRRLDLEYALDSIGLLSDKGISLVVCFDCLLFTL